MKLTPEQLAEWKALVHKLNNDADDHMGVAHSIDMPPEHTANYRHAKNTHEAVWAITNLIADLEEERRRSSISEAFAKELSSELISTRKQLAEAQSRDGSTAPVAAIKFSLKTDCGDQFLRCWVEGSFDAIRSEWPEAPEAVFIGADPLHPNTQQTSTASLDAAIAEAIADEKRNPWKQAIINELAVSHVLHTDHETDPVRALAALVDYECKAALDPAVSKEAQALIEPYHKDAERYHYLKGCVDIADDGDNESEWWELHFEYQTGCRLDAAIDAAIAAKGETNEQTT